MRSPERLVELVREAPDGLIVEVGVTFTDGPLYIGSTAALYDEAGDRYVGVELDPEHAEEARRRAPGANILEGDSNALVPTLGPVAVLHLDGSVMAHHAYRDFRTAPLVPGAIVVVDDEQLGRADHIRNHLLLAGHPFTVEHGDGYGRLIVTIS